MRRHWVDVLAWGLILLYIVTFVWLAILRHASFNSSGFDLGIYDQVTWNTLHGRFFFYTTTGQPLLHFSNHVSPILLLAVPFYLIYSGPETLLFLQTTAIALGGLPLFWLAREKLTSNAAALSLLLAYLLFPTLQIVNLWDFHPPVLSVPFFMFAFYFLEKRRLGWFFMCALIAMLGKEQLPLQVAFLGLYALIGHRQWGWGLATIGVALSWFFIIMYWIIPANSVTGDHLFIGYYADLGDSPAEIVLTAVTRPDVVIRNLWQPAKLQYLFDVLTPFAYLPLLGLPVLLIGTPSFAINLLSANTAMYDATGAQYGADIAPWLAWAALFGMVYLRRGLTHVWLYTRPRLTKSVKLLPPTQVKTKIPPSGGRGGPEPATDSTPMPWLTGTIAATLLVTALIWQLSRGFSPLALDPPSWEITAHDRLAHEFIAQIPPDASISAQGKLYPHLSNRLIAYQLPDVNNAEYVFADITRGTWPIHPNDLWATLRELLASSEYGVQAAADGYLLLRRGLPEATVPDAFYDFARVAEATPQYPARVQFGEALQLLGFDLIDDPRRQETAVRLYWRALKPMNDDLRLYPFFIDDQGHIIEDTELRPLLTQLWYPPRQWQPGEIIVAETMPWALGDRWSLAVGILNGKSWADWSQRLPVQVIDAPQPLRRFEANTWVRLSSFERQGRTLAEIVPPEQDLQPMTPFMVNFDQQMELIGYDAPSPIDSTASALPVTLYWHALAALPLDYTIFVHLIGPDGQRVAQNDDTPRWEVPIPTSTWQPGEILKDQHLLDLPPDLSPGTYRLQAGVYYWQTLERLSVIENGTPVNNFVELGTIIIE